MSVMIQETPDPAASDVDWQQALEYFRARARQLFEAQRERVQVLESNLIEQITRIDEQIAAEQNEQTAARTNSGSPTQAEHQDLLLQLAQTRKLLNARADELKQLRRQLAERPGEASDVDLEMLLEQIADVQAERDELANRLVDAQRKLERATLADAEQLDEVRCRFETAVQEIRELKSRNAELQQQLERRGNSPEASPSANAGFSWEQQKRRLLEQLESDCGELEPARKQERLTIEGTIRITDQVIAEKDRQIAELKQQLAGQSLLANGVSAADALDRDQGVQQERERLSRLKEEFRAKSRQAEIDLSLERAKLARERAELEAKLRTLEETRETSVQAAASRDGASPASAKPSGRWLSRLGLKDNDK